MAVFADGLKPFSFHIEAGDERVPTHKPFRADTGLDVIGLHLVLRVELKTFRAAVEFALAAGLRVEPVLDIGVFDADVLLRPARASQGTLDEGNHPRLGPAAAIVGPFNVFAFGHSVVFFFVFLAQLAKQGDASKQLNFARLQSISGQTNAAAARLVIAHHVLVEVVSTGGFAAFLTAHGDLR